MNKPLWFWSVRRRSGADEPCQAVLELPSFPSDTCFIFSLFSCRLDLLMSREQYFQHHLQCHVCSYCAWSCKGLPSFWLSFSICSKAVERSAWTICCFNKQNLFPGQIVIELQKQTRHACLRSIQEEHRDIYGFCPNQTALTWPAEQ